MVVSMYGNFVIENFTVGIFSRSEILPYEKNRRSDFSLYGIFVVGGLYLQIIRCLYWFWTKINVKYLNSYSLYPQCFILFSHRLLNLKTYNVSAKFPVARIFSCKPVEVSGYWLRQCQDFVESSFTRCIISSFIWNNLYCVIFCQDDLFDTTRHWCSYMQLKKRISF